MKNSTKITLGSLLIAGAGVFAISKVNLNDNKLTSYSPRVNSNNLAERSAAGMMKFYESIRANVSTGKIEANDYVNAFNEVKNFNRSASRSATLNFVDEGPDNVGGRTRTILVDKDDINTVYAGNVSGGLYKSTNRGNTWSRVYAFNTTLSISTMAQTKSGTIYIGTGPEFEGGGFSNGGTGGHRANGVWYTNDGGATFQQLTPTTSFGTAAINQIVADPIANDKIWIAGQFPVRLTSCENKTTFNSVSNIVSAAQDVKISEDGSVLVVNQGSRTFVSTDFGATFTKVSGFSTGEIKEIAQTPISRIEYAISHEKNNQGKYNIYAVQIKQGGVLGKLAGISISLDNGQTWTEVKPQTPGALDALAALPSDPFSGGTQWQGEFDCIIEAIPNSNDFIVGGVRLFKYEMSTSNPPNGNFFEIASNQADETSPFYVHSDIHEFHFDPTGRLYIGTDGGVSISDNIGSSSPNYYVANRGYNTTQFYGIGYGVDGSLIGGSQDNSCVYKDATALGTTPQEFRTVSGGDGFDSEISSVNPSVIFTSVQQGIIQRSPDKGTTTSGFTSSEMTGLPTSFYTTMRLFENKNDTNSTDSVFYFAQANKLAGETIMVPSKNMNILFPYTLTQNINVVYDSIFVTNDTLITGTPYESGDTALIITARDTIRVQDKIQTLYATGLVGTGGVWVTRGALRFGGTPIWWKVLSSVNEVKALEFSKDGNILYVGETNGRVTRIKGFNNVYYNNEANDTINGITGHDSVSYNYADIRSGVSQLEVQVIYNGGGGQAATGIGVDPNDPENVVVTLGGYGGTTHVIRSTTAASTTGTSSFTSIQGDLPDMPVFDAIIDVTNSNLIVIGTEFGIYASDNFGVSWSPQLNDAGIVPVFAMRQQWRPWGEAYTNSGIIYAGTHGRGIWSSATLSSIDETPTIIDEEDLVKVISVYPNPANQFTNITFDLNETTDVNINVYNMQGKLVKSNTIKNASEGAFKTQLNINNLTKGTYFVNINAGNGKFKTAKFIKN